MEALSRLAKEGPSWLEVARLAFLSRQLDQLEIERLTPAGQVQLQLSSSGHELAQILVGVSLEHPRDAATIYYRSRPFLLASGLTAKEALAASLARCGSPSEGRDVGVVFNLPRRQRATVLPASGNVGLQFTPAVGWAQAIEYHRDVLKQPDWDGAVAVAMGGEGSTATPGFWAALNIATTLRLPLLFVIEDNGFAISTPASLQTPEGNIAANLEAFANLEIADASGSDPAAAWRAINDALGHVRGGHGPCLLRLRVPRLTGHAFRDKQLYKSSSLLAEEAARDPLFFLKDYLLSAGIVTPQVLNDLARDVEREVDAALTAASALAEPAAESARRHVFFEEAPLQGGLRPQNVQLPPGKQMPNAGGEPVDLREAVRRTLLAEMEQNDRILLFGEDVARMGGIHGMTRDLQRELGEARVFDTSLSEEGIIGRAVGMALSGLLPVPELQFRKYADAAHEQLADLGTIRWRTAGRFAAPLVVRIPAGCGKHHQGDPWHAMTAEAVYAHLVGWKIAFPSNAEDAAGLLRTALRGDDPTFFFEHRGLLVEDEAVRPYPGDEYCLPFGVAATRSRGDAVTVVSWGQMVHRCAEVAEALPDKITLFDLRTLIPWDRAAVLESVRQTGRLLVVHEDTATGGFAGEIIATVVAEAFAELKAPPERVAALDCPIPYNAQLRDRVIPGSEQIRATVEQLLATSY
ncbi:MAG: pyruvate dehydrogenase [Planctomycetota bacterium]|nr:MAG: pyruvate dehydrogenase [Planctomycetota bacterium]